MDSNAKNVQTWKWELMGGVCDSLSLNFKKMETKANLPTKLHKSGGAISKGYNFASLWEQNSPLTEQQQASIVTLSHAVSDRPFPPNLAQDHVSRQENGLDVSTKGSTLGFENSTAINTVLVNTNQFYKWFTDLESAIKSETEEKYRQYVNTLTLFVMVILPLSLVAKV